MTLKELKFIFNWITNNYEVKDIGGWHLVPERLLEEFLEDNKIEEEKKDGDE